jgi:hypothetical protein
MQLMSMQSFVQTFANRILTMSGVHDCSLQASADLCRSAAVTIVIAIHFLAACRYLTPFSALWKIATGWRSRRGRFYPDGLKAT